ncbi:MAG TPA: VTT domain-containing protein, partial [Flavisolibacter sp.]|nr:VTT domain-containing protein [Flavisolibacter sp.]
MDTILSLFRAHPDLAILISLALSIVIALAGVLPSFFLTAANIYFFGFWQGTLLSFAGEATGAFLAFLLYRRGLRKTIAGQLDRYPRARNLIQAKGRQAFLMVIALRLLPFVPSGIVTFAAAVGSITPVSFLLASSIGKIPALLLEAYAVSEVAQFHWQGKLILLIAAVVLLIAV